ncbi:MAG TPA: TerC family protein [Actinomycetota bacterium]|nr:TerC family protein [Actinomycetota bacterium]
MEWLSEPDIWIGFVTLLALEIVLGIDNVVFISILAGKLPAAQQARARQVGLGLALVMRILLLLTLSWVIGLTSPLFSLIGHEISGRDLILIVGGLFLLGKSTYEIHDRLEGEEGHAADRVAASFSAVIAQIVVLDAVFSLDSVITAVGMVDELGVMIAAVIVAVGIMLISAGAISTFVNRHPTVKMLALSFLLLIGLALLLDGFDQHIPKGYIYFAMGFSLLVELLNLRARARRQEPVRFHQRYADRSEQGRDLGQPATGEPASVNEPQSSPRAGPPPPTLRP